MLLMESPIQEVPYVLTQTLEENAFLIREPGATYSSEKIGTIAHYVPHTMTVCSREGRATTAV